jgi:tetratricopeptide (TPR) repeat protein
LCAAVWLLCVAACGNPTPSAYDAELVQIQQRIAALKGNASDTWMARVQALYHRASLSGRMQDAQTADTAISDAMRLAGATPDLYLLRARLDYAFHRLSGVRDNLRLASAQGSSPRITALQADVDMQEGRIPEARAQYEAVLRANRTWDNLARLANWHALYGDIARADALYVEAENEVTAREMRAYAWLSVQRGVLAFRHGRHDEALTHYQRADKAYSGYWLVGEHLAELYGAQRRYDEAVALYEKVIERAPRPELYQALGELYIFMGKPERARPWLDKALADYLSSVQRGEVHYFHHLAGFYADVREDGAEAVKWARKDLELRRNPATHDALAWALYRAGRFDEALMEMDKALGTGVKDTHVFVHAAMIYAAAGRSAEGTRFMQQAAAFNPRFEAFHVHR